MCGVCGRQFAYGSTLYDLKPGAARAPYDLPMPIGRGEYTSGMRVNKHIKLEDSNTEDSEDNSSK